jgi:hypothetical protein
MKTMRNFTLLSVLLLLSPAPGCDEGPSPGGDAGEDLVGDDGGACADCDDLDECTVDSCSEGACRHDPVPDRTPCADGGGICCGGECRAGGECCSDADCMGGCKGTPRECSLFGSATQCDVQRECIWNAAGSCSGDPMGCIWGSGSEELCESCGCTYHRDYDSCSDDPAWPCDVHIDQDTCISCECEWTPPGCAGARQSCADFPNEDICNSQLDCYWRACVNYVCT